MSSGGKPAGGGGGQSGLKAANRAFKAGTGAQFTFNFNFVAPSGESGGSGASQQSRTTTNAGGAACGARAGPSFCFNFNIPASMAPQFMSNFANQVEQMTGGGLPSDPQMPMAETSGKFDAHTNLTAIAQPAVAPALNKPAPAAAAAASARPWETQGVKPVEKPAWAMAAMGGLKVSQRLRLS